MTTISDVTLLRVISISYLEVVTLFVLSAGCLLMKKSGKIRFLPFALIIMYSLSLLFQILNIFGKSQIQSYFTQMNFSHMRGIINLSLIFLFIKGVRGKDSVPESSNPE